MTTEKLKLVPKNGHSILVLGIARVSKEKIKYKLRNKQGDEQLPLDEQIEKTSNNPPEQEKSLEDQEALLRNWSGRHLEGSWVIDMCSGTGSGERLDREEILRAFAAVGEGDYDLVLMEDSSRAYRRVHLQLLCELCEDTGTRLIAINDNIDTARSDWRVLAGIANLRHELYNDDTSKRIGRSQR